MANTITHGSGLLFSLAAFPILVWMAANSGDVWRVVACSIYGISLVLLYASSTLYHASRQPRIKRLFQTFDYAGIYLLIAGTYTPFTLVNMRGLWGWTLFTIVWALGIVGVFLSLVAIDLSCYISPVIYVGMGWLVMIGLKPLLAAVSTQGVVWLFCGGVAYTAGLIFFAWERFPYGHAVWHCFVLAGSLCHFKAVLVAVLPVAH